MSDAESAVRRRIIEIDELTAKACEAAERGDWDTVEHCVGRRASLFGTVAVPTMWKARWLAMNEQIRVLAEDAKSAIEVALQEAGRTRRSLDRLQQGQVSTRDERSRLMDMRA